MKSNKKLTSIMVDENLLNQAKFEGISLTDILKTSLHDRLNLTDNESIEIKIKQLESELLNKTNEMDIEHNNNLSVLNNQYKNKIKRLYDMLADADNKPENKVNNDIENMIIQGIYDILRVQHSQGLKLDILPDIDILRDKASEIGVDWQDIDKYWSDINYKNILDAIINKIESLNNKS